MAFSWLQDKGGGGLFSSPREDQGHTTVESLEKTLKTIRSNS